MNKINQNFFICAPSISQAAGLEALQCVQETQSMLEEYQLRRDYITKRVNEIEGISMIPPTGAFYAFINVKQQTNDTVNFALNLLKDGLIATTPGIAFGSNGEGYLRFSYCTSIENIEEGMNRLESFIKTH
jgi:aspartate/methionine/tyrosine aminotransferase